MQPAPFVGAVDKKSSGGVNEVAGLELSEKFALEILERQ
jgi:hypothetical protein